MTVLVIKKKEFNSTICCWEKGSPSKMYCLPLFFIPGRRSVPSSIRPPFHPSFSRGLSSFHFKSVAVPRAFFALYSFPLSFRTLFQFRKLSETRLHLPYVASASPRQMFRPANGRDSFQLFVGVFDTCLVGYLLVLPSETHAVANMTSFRAID